MTPRQVQRDAPIVGAQAGISVRAEDAARVGDAHSELERVDLGRGTVEVRLEQLQIGSREPHVEIDALEAREVADLSG